jgi:phosphoglycolate phosphatase-like HAD superfamily hydrolase
VQMAQSAHVRVVGVLGPFPTEKRLRAAKPDLLLNSITELPAALKQLEKSIREIAWQPAAG